MKEVVNDFKLMMGIDDKYALEDDDAYELSSEMCKEVMATTNNIHDVIFFSRVPRFNCSPCYRLQLQDFIRAERFKKELMGLLWMTATMRRNYKLFGSFICVDMMKRAINTLLWPYTAVTMLDEMKKFCVGCEGIVCGERQDMYGAQAAFLEEYAPGCPLSEVLIVAGDRFFNQSVVVSMGFTNATFIVDQWHLYDSG